MDLRKSILLFNPNLASPAWRSARYYATPPLSLLAIAGPLRDAGYRVRILDAKWEVDWRAKARELADDLLCAGVTSLTGPCVAEGLEFAELLKQSRPELPVVWGGWHATFAADQAIEDPRVDFVVRGMGERTFVELAQALEAGTSPGSIAGVHFRGPGGPDKTPDRPPEDIGKFPPPAYELIQPERYIEHRRDGLRQASTIFSRGCPFACEFCLDSRTRWLGLGIDRMLDDIRFWIARGANAIQFYDGNFFLGRSRLLEICDATIAAGLHTQFRWIATGVGNRVAQMDDELLARLKKAGLMQVAIGAESGSDQLLGRITNKTTVANTLESVQRLTRHGIDQHLFFVVGYPDEPGDALEATFELAIKAKKINPRISMFMNFATPLPGSEMFRSAVERGLVEAPRTFAEWARFDYVAPNLAAIDRKYQRNVERFTRYLGLAYGAERNSSRTRILEKAARHRLERKYFDFPIELSLQSGVRSARQGIRRVLGMRSSNVVSATSGPTASTQGGGAMP